ncbi:MAG: HAD family phosphatase [Verrucomicrobia bacterium]|nr:HAD family phosphatase [Verrucomicrobiota bacterium]
MSLPFKLLSTDFDGTLFAEFENPPVPRKLQELIGSLQTQGVKWVINTGRELSSLMESMGRAHLTIKPDYLVLVEREIYTHDNLQYVGLPEWNDACTRDHEEVFTRVRQDVTYLNDWVSQRFSKATIYSDPYSPFCLIAEKTADAEAIHEFLDGYCERVPGLVVVRNDVYARFSHVNYNKGTALTELARRLDISSEHILAAGDHLNDLPMLKTEHARWLVTNANAVPQVKEQVRQQNGYISEQHCGHGVADGIEFVLNGG